MNAKSLNTYNKTGEFIEKSCKEGRDISRIIIGSIADTEPIFTPRSLGKTGNDLHLSGISQESRSVRRQQILNTSLKDLELLAKQLDTLIPEMSSIVVASEDILDQCRTQELISNH